MSYRARQRGTEDLQNEVQKQQKQNERLEAVVKTLLKENALLRMTLTEREEFEKEERENLEQVVLNLEEVLKTRHRSNTRWEEVGVQVRDEWYEFCNSLTLGCEEVERVIEDIKDRLITAETADIMVGLETHNT